MIAQVFYCGVRIAIGAQLPCWKQVPDWRYTLSDGPLHDVTTGH